MWWPKLMGGRGLAYVLSSRPAGVVHRGTLSQKYPKITTIKNALVKDLDIWT